MKSVKKRFKTQLKQLQTSVNHLLWLCQDIEVLQGALPTLNDALQACAVLRTRTTELDKAFFATEMMEEEALDVLAALLDLDLISLVEQRCFRIIPTPETAAATLLQQLLHKLEIRYGTMLEEVRELMMLLEESQ